MAQIIKINSFGTEVKIFVNPNNSCFLKLLENYDGKLRATTDKNGDLYVWDAYNAIHSVVETELSLDVMHSMILDHGTITLEYDVDFEEISGISGISRAYATMGYEIFNDSMIDSE